MTLLSVAALLSISTWDVYGKLVPNSVVEYKRKTGSVDTVLLCLKQTCGLFFFLFFRQACPQQTTLRTKIQFFVLLWLKKDHKLTDLGLNVYFEVYNLFKWISWQEGSITGIFFMCIKISFGVSTTFIFNLILPAARHSHLYLTLFQAFILFFFPWGENLSCSFGRRDTQSSYLNIPLSFWVWLFLSVLPRGNK